MNAYSQIKPDFASIHSTERDVSDLWLEVADPENERGEYVEGFYRVVDTDGVDEQFRACPGDELELLGIAIEDTATTIYRSRAWLADRYGMDLIYRMEAA